MVLNQKRINSLAFPLFCGKRLFSNRKTYLEVLGLDENASKKEVKEAYLKLSKEFHPDVNKDATAPGRYQQIRDAYDQLQLKTRNTFQKENQTSEQEYKETRSEEFVNWKRRTEKKKGLDDWLKEVERKAREDKLRMKKDDEGRQETSKKFYTNEESFDKYEVNEVKHSQEYLVYEKKFILRLDSLLDKFKTKNVVEKQILGEIKINKDQSKASSENSKFLAVFKLFIPLYAKWILTTAPLVIVGVAATLLGINYELALVTSYPKAWIYTHLRTMKIMISAMKRQLSERMGHWQIYKYNHCI